MENPGVVRVRLGRDGIPLPAGVVQQGVRFAPLLEVAAGEPLLAVQNITDYFPIPVEYLPNAETFMLKVKGDSMINVGIFDGDNLLIEVCSDARNGEIVVALVEDGATVKRFFKEDGHIRLQPENDSMDPIIVNDVTILGRVIGLFRMMR